MSHDYVAQRVWAVLLKHHRPRSCVYQAPNAPMRVSGFLRQNQEVRLCACQERSSSSNRRPQTLNVQIPHQVPFWYRIVTHVDHFGDHMWTPFRQFRDPFDSFRKILGPHLTQFRDAHFDTRTSAVHPLSKTSGTRCMLSSLVPTLQERGFVVVGGVG